MTAEYEEYVDSLLRKLFLYIDERKEKEISQIYDTLSDSKLKDTPWPCFTTFDYDNHGYGLLYREMWYRRICAPTLEQRLNCYSNYSLLLGSLAMLNILFPNQWLWDTIDGFVNQFQSYWEYRRDLTKLYQQDNLKRKRTEQDIRLLEHNDQCWSVDNVLSLLETIHEDTNQIIHKENYKLQLFKAATSDDDMGDTRPRVLRHFSRVGLFRVYCLLGSYQTGLDCVRPSDIRSQQGFYTCVIDCHITTVFHYGFANLMLHRYVEAIVELNKFLVYIFKTEQKSPQIEILNKKMYALLAICLSLCPLFQLIDENVNSQLMQKYGQKISKMKRCNKKLKVLYRKLLSYVWPTFAKTPFAPSSGDPRELLDMNNIDKEWLALAYPIFCGPNAPRCDQVLVNHNQVDVVVANMFQIKKQ